MTKESKKTWICWNNNRIHGWTTQWDMLPPSNNLKAMVKDASKCMKAQDQLTSWKASSLLLLSKDKLKAYARKCLYSKI